MTSFSEKIQLLLEDKKKWIWIVIMYEPSAFLFAGTDNAISVIASFEKLFKNYQKL